MTVRLGIPAKLVATDASDTQMDWRNLTTRNADSTIRTGITGPVAPGLTLVTPTASTGPMTVQVGAFDAVASRDNGAVFLCNDGITPASGAGSVAIAAAPAAGSSRQDVVYVMQHDSSGGVTTPDADNLVGIFVATGNPTTGTPTKPAIPAAAVELATVLVPSGATATNSGGVVIAQTFQYTASAGGSVPFPTEALLGAWAALDGQRAYAFDTSRVYQNFQGAATPGWKLIGGKPSIGAFTPGGIYTAGSPTPQAVQQSSSVFLEGAVASSSASFVAGTTYAIGSIPATLAPGVAKVFACITNVTALAQVTVSPTGAISFVSNVSFTGLLSLQLAGSWRAKGY